MEGRQYCGGAHFDLLGDDAKLTKTRLHEVLADGGGGFHMRKSDQLLWRAAAPVSLKYTRNAQSVISTAAARRTNKYLLRI